MFDFPKLPINVGYIDRIVRLVIGAVLLLFTVVGPQSLWGLIGLYPISTGLLRHCPVYRAFKLDTREFG